MQRLRVLWLVKGLGPGGAETLLLSIARVADHERFGYEAAYVLPWKDHLVPRLEQEGVQVHCLDGSRLAHPGWVLRLRRLLRARAYDVVHLHSPLIAGVTRLVVRTLPRRDRPRVVSTEHNTWWSYARVTRWLNALLYRTDHARFAVSDEVRSTIWPRLREDVEVLVHGLVLDDVQAARAERPSMRRELDVDDATTVVGTVANFRVQKGYPDLLAAAAVVLERRSDVLFVAVGQGPLEDEVRRRHAELGLGERFRLLGYRQDVPRVLAGCDVFALASLHEGLPVALMECLATGIPVVVTSVGGIPEVVVDGVHGFTVPPSRPDLLAERLLQLVEQPELRRRFAMAARDAGRRFDIAHAVRRLEDVYDR